MKLGRGKHVLLLGLCILGTLLFGGLGIWQIERREWKLDLIARVEARVHARPAPLPPRSAWAGLEPRDIEYRRVRTTGRFDYERETLVDALTELGAGSWVITPLSTAGGVVLVNRGFVPVELKPPAGIAAQPTGQVTVTGLLRPSEPEGRFLRPNEPAAERWFSRDVAAIARARGLGEVAPFFIDAERGPDPAAYPVAGLTVIQFRNAHLVYALTWFALAGLSLAGLVLLLHPAQRRR